MRCRTTAWRGRLRSGTLHRSFQGYTTHANRDLVSFGVSAIGQVGDLYVQNRKSVPEYEAAVASGALPSFQGVHISADDAIRKDVIGQIMCHGMVNIGAVQSRHGIEFERYFARELGPLKSLEADGLIERSRADRSHRGRPPADAQRGHDLRCVHRRRRAEADVASDLRWGADPRRGRVFWRPQA